MKQLGCTPAQILQWQGVVSAIPSEWKKTHPLVVRPEPPIAIVMNGVLTPLTGCNTRQIRKHISTLYFTPPISKLYFEQLFDVNECEWKFFFNLPFLVTLDCKLREFQWKLSHNIIFTNVTLHRMRPPRVQSSLCSSCHQSDETLIHLFVNCKFTKSLWRAIIDRWGTFLQAPSTLTDKQIILGDPSFNLLLNHIIIITKKTIYDCKIKSIIPSINNVKANIIYVQRTEEYISKKNSTTNLHWKKWGDFAV